MPTSFAPARPAPDRTRSDLLLFLGVAFAVSWGSWGAAMGIGGPAANGEPAYVPFLFGAFGPLIGALVIRIRRRRRGEPVPAHAVRFRAATALLWTPPLMVLASATVLGAAVLGHAAGDPALSWEGAEDAMKSMGGPAAFLVSMLLSGPLSEEPGWRGTAYPRMRATMGRFRIGLTLGVIWAVWHLPLFFIDGTVQNGLGLASPGGVLFAVSNIPMAMLVSSAYERAGVVASIAVHFAVNTTMILLDVHSPVTQALIIGVQAAVVTVLLATGRRSAASPSGSPTGTPTVVAEADGRPKQSGLTPDRPGNPSPGPLPR
ncbi:CPBP family intramembrane glutamic endopeptidase [Streptomyces tsukubensis]|uniref:CAAX protease family protein n=1 Tax=Streptomyces tsukubensis TaxID=83656 RepID=A0A1V4A855_9ACTN|nr:type II CAAX endopeptidase family protein [Streptomyces tsukubensis]OON78813.1 CAAX protease family protein [Streptomyces tsukubensis]QFR94290.1 CPBP family intramembrane metalloprotease [Streptomyces tsukubensis]